MRVQKRILASLMIVALVTTSCAALRGGMQTPVPFLSSELTYPPVPTVVEPGLAYGIPCWPPCWQNLTPGKSTTQDADREMARLRASGWAYSVEGDYRGYTIRPSPDSIHGTIFIKMKEGVVDRIMGNVLFDLPIGILIRRIGEPEALYVMGGGKCNSCEEGSYGNGNLTASELEGHGWHNPVHLLYPTQGMWFLMLSDRGGCICPEMKVVAFCYYTPLTVEEALEHLEDLCGAGLYNVRQERLIKWHGFGGGY
jgi:hypothetical protein